MYNELEVPFSETANFKKILLDFIPISYFVSEFRSNCEEKHEKYEYFEVSKNAGIIQCPKRLVSQESLINKIPKTGESFVGNIPRLENVALGIGLQNLDYENKSEIVSGSKIPLIARILKLVLDFEKTYSVFQNPSLAFEELQKNSRKYDPELLKIFHEKVLFTILDFEENGIKLQVRERKIKPIDLEPGMIVNRDIFDLEGRLIVSSGTFVTTILKTRLENYFLCKAIKDPVIIRY